MSGVRFHYTDRAADTRWWEKTEPEERGSAAMAAAMAVDRISGERHRQLRDAFALYGDASLLGGLVEIVPVARRLSHNVVANVVDTFVSEVTQVEPRPMAEMTGGGFDQQ